jgi:hypothetical protein
MINKTYEKLCAGGQLTAEITSAGLAQIVNLEAPGRFYGVSCLGGDAPKTTVHMADDATLEEQAQVDAVVAAHVPA